jgi:glucose-1-phosphate thymidylyltransferase
MKVIILAGGFARRLWPLTLKTPKPLLRVAGRSVLDYIVDEVTVLGSRVNDVIVLTNAVFADDFSGWARTRANERIRVISDGSTSDTAKVGAVGAIRLVIDDIRDDLLILAGDCLFLDHLGGLVGLFDSTDSPVVGLYRPISDDQLLRGSAVSIDGRGVITSFVEKPRVSSPSLVGAVMYAFPRRIRSRFDEYSATGLSMDEPGRFLEWLISKEEVYGYLLEHHVWDIGTLEAYQRADMYLHGSI